MNLRDIQYTIENDQFEIQIHALERMDQRDISMSELEKSIQNGEIMREYPDDTPYPSCLIEGVVRSRTLHVVVGYNKTDEKSYIITVYEPGT